MKKGKKKKEPFFHWQLSDQSQTRQEGRRMSWIHQTVRQQDPDGKDEKRKGKRETSYVNWVTNGVTMSAFYMNADEMNGVRRNTSRSIKISLSISGTMRGSSLAISFLIRNNMLVMNWDDENWKHHDVGRREYDLRRLSFPLNVRNDSK